MRSFLLVTSFVSVAATLGLYGCSSAPETLGSDEAAATSAEINQARKAVALIAGAQAHCTQCHTAAKSDVLRWGQAMQRIEHDCLDPALTMTSQERISCMSEEPDVFSANKLGLYAAGAGLSQFSTLFGSDTASYESFKQQVRMPASSTMTAFTETEFTSIKKWVLAGMPALDEALQDPDLGPCTTSLSPSLADHIAAMTATGWGARLAEAATPMYGCGTGSGRDCLTSLPEITSRWNAAGEPQTLRELHQVPFRSHWWIRSSPDGRFVGFGLNNAAKVVDLNRPASSAPIDVRASYDPQFFPNNEGFSFAGAGGGNGPIKVCKQSVLLNATNQITLNETGCSTIISSVYQTVGAALDSELYLMSTGTHVNDDAEATGSGPRPGFDASATTILTPMVNDGVKFVPQPKITLSLPFEGDQALSPSNKLLVTRFGSKSGKRGFRIRRLNVTTTPGGGGAAATYSASTEVMGTVCLNGAKPVVSYDERFVVTHQYVDPTEGTGLPEQSSNIVLADLKTGEVVRLTSMKDRQYAFAPHFRADGWIYFIVRDMNSSTETVVASDAALRRLAATR